MKEIYATLQGEGAQAGRAAIFCRFSGCNLWNGREADRANAVCQFCDTDFVGTNGPNGGVYDAVALSKTIEQLWPGGSEDRWVVCTGGEPLLQLDEPLVAALHQRGFSVAIETNGTRPVPAGVDWVCVSPKAGADLIVRAGQELKLVYPQSGAEPERFADLDFHHFFLQPMDGLERVRHTRAAIDYCLKNPRWRLSIQTHKLLGIP